MIKLGEVNELEITHFDEMLGYLLNADGAEILLPKHEADNLPVGATIRVFLYHNSKGVLMATLKEPLAVVGQVAKLYVVEITPNGAFLKWGIDRDLFLPNSLQINAVEIGESYTVYVFLDTKTNRVLANMYLEEFYKNEDIQLAEKEPVEMTVYRKTDLGYLMILNNKHIGLLHYNEVFKELEIGSTHEGFIKRITLDNKINVMIGKLGHLRVTSESDNILNLLSKTKDGFLPYHDKTDAETIYKVFGVSKKTFKMNIGRLYREKKIHISETGITLLNN